VTESTINRARLERILVDVLADIYDRMQTEDHLPLLTAAGRLDLEAQAPAIVRELSPQALAKLDAVTDETLRQFFRARIEPAYRRAAAEAGDRPS
jgi:hypothetical protein